MASASTMGAALRAVWAILRWAFAWSRGRARFIGKVMLTALAARVFFGTGAAVLVLVAGWLGPALGLGAWQHFAPLHFEQRVGGPLRRRRWRKWVESAWPGFADRAGLSHSESGTHRNRWNGTTTKIKVVSRPRLVNVSTQGERLDVTVSTRLGQTVADLEAVAPALADAAGAHSVRAVSEAPGMVRFEMVMRDLLSAPFPARPATQATTDAVTLGRCEDGSPFALTIAERHTLITGCSGSGKGSFFWGVALGFAPAIQAGLVELIGIDLKYGMEARIGANLFAGLATTDDEAVRALSYAFDVVERRGRALAGHSRKHTPRVGDPLLVLLIDEMAALTSYMQDKEAKKEADRLLRSILTKGRAVGVVVVGALQDPRKETLAARELFTQTVALRLRSKSEVAMVLGEGMAETAPAHRIHQDQQGMAYVVVDDGTTQRIRAGFAPDSLIRQCAATYGTGQTVDLSTPASDAAPKAETANDPSTTRERESTSSSQSAKASTSGRKPRSPRKPRNRTRATSGASASGSESA